nr:hypothetical protein [Tanacetum cinerariifolium]
MHTRSQSRNNFPQQEASPAIGEPLRIELPFLKDQFQEDPPVHPPEVPMADIRTMAELLQAPTEGYEDATVIPEIATNNFELKHGLINLIQNKQFFGHDKEEPHAYIRYFNKITSTMRVPNQRFDESFYEAWDHFNELLRACPHHRFSELHQLDTFYNALNVNDHDSLNSAAGGNFLDKMPRECLKIIESKSKGKKFGSLAIVVLASIKGLAKSVLDTECIILSSDFKLLDENHVLLRVPRENNMYNVDLKNIVPSEYPLGKFDGKADEGFLVGYFINRSGPTWLFDIDTLTKSMNYQPVIAGNQPNHNAGIQEHFVADKAGEGNVQQYVLFLLWSSGSKDPQNTDDDTEYEVKEPESEVHVSPSSIAKTKKHDEKTKREAKGKSLVELSTGIRNLSEEFEDFFDNSINEVNAASTPVTIVGQNSTNSTNTFSAAGPSNTDVTLEDITYSDDDEDVGAEADFSNLEPSILVSPIPTARVHKDHLVTQIIGDLSSVTQTRSMTRMVKDQGGFTQINNEDFHTCMFSCFLSQKEPKSYIKLLKIPVGLKLCRRSFFNSRCKSAFLYETIEEEGYVCQTLGLEDPDYPDKVYKVVKALYGLHQTLRDWYETMANYLLENGFQRGQIDQTMLIKKKKGDILLVQVYVEDIIFGSTNKDFQDKYVAKILRKFGLTDEKSTSTPIDTEKPLLKDHDGEDVDVHTYRSMIGSLMYLTSSRPDIMFDVCVCAHFQVTPKALHLHAIKRILRYLKGKPHLGLWYPKDSPLNLVAYLDSDYAGASLDRKSTAGGC